MEQLTLGQRIKAARIGKGLTLSELGSKVALVKSSVSRLENDKYVPSIEILLKIAEVLEAPKLAELDFEIQENSDSNMNETVGRRIRIARKLERLSITDLSKATGFAHSYISNIEREVRNPSIQVLKAISKVLKSVSFSELLDLAGYEDLIPEEGQTENEKVQTIDILGIFKSQTLGCAENLIHYNGHPLSTDELSRVLQVLEAMFPEYRERGQ